MTEQTNNRAPALEIRGLSAAYNGHLAVDHVNIDLYPGERMALLGPNGAGKSTLFKAIVGLLPRSGGQVLLHSYPLEQSGPVLAYIPQRRDIDWNFPVTVREVAMMGRIRQVGRFGWPGKQDWLVVHDSLERVNMADLAHRRIGELSGGQQQRVFIARALAQGADVMLMDEPLGGVDVTTQTIFFQLLDDLKARGVAALVAMHDLALAQQYFDRIALINQKLVAVGEPDQVLKPDHLQMTYGGQVTVIQSGGVEIMVPHTHGDCCA